MDEFAFLSDLLRQIEGRILKALREWRLNLAQTTGQLAGTSVEAASESGPGVLTLARDLGGTAAAPLVIGLQGRDLASTAPSDGQAVVWNASGSTWEPGDVVTGGYATTIGNGSTTVFTITHNLGTRDVIVAVRKAASTYDYVMPDIAATTVDTITVTFATAPSTNEYRVIVGTGGGVVGGGGGGTTFPTIVQAKYAGTGVTSLTLDAAPVAGHALILITDATTGQVSAVSQTNVTWTQVKTHTSGGSSYYAIWVGVAAASAGTAITITKPGSFNSAICIEVTDALTPTLGQSASADAGASFGTSTAPTTDNLVVMGGGADNTTLFATLSMTIPSVGIDNGIVGVMVGYATGQKVYGMLGQSAGGAMIAEIT